MDDKRRVAMAETNTTSGAASILRYQIDDRLGSASLELDASAAIISYEEYYPYGGTSYQAGRTLVEVSLKRYRYTGKERDEETGMTYHGARYYAPWLARWTEPDPAGLVGGTNPYCYASNNPVRLVDPDGKQPKANSQDEAIPPPPPPDNKVPDDVPEPKKDPPEKKYPQPTVYNSGPTQTAFVPGDVGQYVDQRPKPPLGSLVFEGNGFVLGGSQQSKGQVSSSIQIAVRVRTGDDTEQGFIGTAGGQTGTGTAIASGGYQLHQGTSLDTRDEAPFQKGQGNWFSLTLQSTPQEKPQTPSVNAGGNYLHAWSYAWGGGNTLIDLNAGANFAARGAVNGRDVWGSLNPFVGINASHQFGGVSLNLEGVVGPNLGAALVNSVLGDPAFPIDGKAAFGAGIQGQLGAKKDYTLGFELLGNVEFLSSVPGPQTWTAGAALTLSAY